MNSKQAGVFYVIFLLVFDCAWCVEFNRGYAGYGSNPNSSYVRTGESQIYVSVDGVCNGHSPCYPTIAKAYQDSENGQEIRVAAGTSDGELSLRKTIAVVLSGGWNSDYGNNTEGRSTVGGSLTIAGGTVTIDRIVIAGSYYPLLPGSWIEYQVNDITGTWHAELMMLDVNTRHGHPNSPQLLEISAAICDGCFGDYPLRKIAYYHDSIQGGSLQDGGAISSLGEEYVGEAVNDGGNVHIPFIAKIAKSPYLDQIIEEYSSVRESCSDCSNEIIPQFHWKYKTIAHYDEWVGFEDCWRTGLIEYHPDTEEPDYRKTISDHADEIECLYREILL